MEVRPGYKQTEVGVIPEDWDVKSIREIGQIKTGPFGTLLKAEEYSGIDGVPLISVGEIGSGTFRVSDRTPRVPDIVIRRLPQYVLRTGDIVFGRKGAVERSALVSELEDGWFLGSDSIGIRPSNLCHSPYLACQFQRHDVQTWLLQNATGTTMASLNQEILSRVYIPYAPLPEQRAIAAVLSDVDGLLTKLDQLIAKKRDLKQAAMQQLLTGQTRLPGFSGEWLALNMSRHASLKARIGWQSLTTEEYLESGTHYLVTGTDFINGRVNWSTCHFVDAWRYSQDRNIQLRNGDVLLTKDGTIGKVGYVEGLHAPATLNSGVFVIRPLQDSFAPLFLFYVLTSRIFDEFLSKITAGSTITHLYQKDFVTFEFYAPRVEEQTAIAAVLSDMDAELAALVTRRDKTRSLKQGMMQELLTGRIRLV